MFSLGNEKEKIENFKFVCFSLLAETSLLGNWSLPDFSSNLKASANSGFDDQGGTFQLSLNHGCLSFLMLLLPGGGWVGVIHDQLLNKSPSPDINTWPYSKERS